MSLWLVAFIAATLLGLFVYLAKTSKLANERASAEFLADRVLEQAIAVGPPVWGLEDESDLAEVLESPPGEDATPLTYQLVVREVGRARLGRLFSLEVNVWWAPGGDATRGVERGRGTLFRERKVYVEDLSEDLP